MQFYLVGDDVSTAQTVAVEPQWKLDDLQRAVGGALHVAQPTGLYSLLNLLGILLR